MTGNRQFVQLANQGHSSDSFIWEQTNDVSTDWLLSLFSNMFDTFHGYIEILEGHLRWTKNPNKPGQIQKRHL